MVGRIVPPDLAALALACDAFAAARADMLDRLIRSSLPPRPWECSPSALRALASLPPACPRAPAFRVPDLGTLGKGGNGKRPGLRPDAEKWGRRNFGNLGTLGKLRGRITERTGRGVRVCGPVKTMGCALRFVYMGTLGSLGIYFSNT